MQSETTTWGLLAARLPETQEIPSFNKRFVDIWTVFKEVLSDIKSTMSIVV